MNNFQTCSCSPGGGIEDFLNCAPCPPPVLSYLQLKFAAAGKLCQKEVCSIAKRCRMKESEELATDCFDIIPFNWIYIIVIVVILSLALILIIIVVVYKRKKSDIKQDTINVVFNDTESETSDKSSDSGSVKIKKKQTNGDKHNFALQEHTNKASHITDDILDPETIVIGTATVPGGNVAQKNGSQHIGQDGLDQKGRVGINAINGHSHVIDDGVRNRVNADKNDSCISAKL